tara:strand:+ start:410 stop:532 length:123 start_codon:yes stop_codon:yes gene_type:complete
MAEVVEVVLLAVAVVEQTKAVVLVHQVVSEALVETENQIV